MNEWLDLISSPIATTDQTLPWIPPPQVAPSIAEATALMALVLFVTTFVAVSELAGNRDRRERARRCLLARHRIFRAPFYRVFAVI